MSRAYISFYTFVLFGGKSLISTHSHTQEKIAADTLGKRDVTDVA